VISTAVVSDHDVIMHVMGLSDQDGLPLDLAHCAMCAFSTILSFTPYGVSHSCMQFNACSIAVKTFPYPVTICLH